jgi:hypothetical protein
MWLEALLRGVVSQPHNMPVKLTIEYTNGSEFTLTGTSLFDLWSEIQKNFVLVAQAQAMADMTEQREHVVDQVVRQAPTFDSQHVREAIQKKIQDMPKQSMLKPKDDDENDQG